MAKKLTDWRDLTLEQQIAQMIVVRASGFLFDHQIRYPQWEAKNAILQDWLENLQIGGIILLGGSAAEIALRTQQLQAISKIPLLICADIEEGVGQRFSGATWFPPPMALNPIAQTDLALAQSLAKKMGAITAQEAIAVGINWILAPVVDVNNNPDNPVINIRAFGEDPAIVGKLATSFIEGAKPYPILTTAKHFPGHGDTAHDSHLELPQILHDEARLAAIELPPFQQAIAAGVDSVMTAHLKIPVWDKDLPATLSPAILTDKLRKQLGFEGLIVTDALIMGGVTQDFTSAAIAVKAVQAGADILLMPADPQVAIAAVLEAVEGGLISPERIQASVARIWQAKQKVTTLPEESSVLEKLTTQLATTTAQATVDQILIQSLEQGKLRSLPPLPPGQGRNLIIVDDLLNRDFLDRQSPAVTLPRDYGYALQLGDAHTLQQLQPDNVPTLLQVFIRGNPFRGSAGLTEQNKTYYQNWLASGTVKGLIIYGSPYVKDWFVKILSQLSLEISWVFSYGQIPAAQRISCQVIFPGAKAKDTRFEN